MWQLTKRKEEEKRKRSRVRPIEPDINSEEPKCMEVLYCSQAADSIGRHRHQFFTISIDCLLLQNPRQSRHCGARAQYSYTTCVAYYPIYSSCKYPKEEKNAVSDLSIRCLLFPFFLCNRSSWRIERDQSRDEKRAERVGSWVMPWW